MKNTTKLAQIDSFLECKIIALAGYSRNDKKFGNKVYDELIKNGFKVYPLNPNAEEINGHHCYPDIFSIPIIPDGLITLVQPEQTELLVKEAYRKGIKKIWLQQGSYTMTAVDYCKTNNINVVYGHCIFMFLGQINGAHKFHRFIWKLFGKYPK